MLIGNGQLYNKVPLALLGDRWCGFVRDEASANPTLGGVPKQTSIPDGYYPPYAAVPARTGGALRYRADQTATTVAVDATGLRGMPGDSSIAISVSTNTPAGELIAFGTGALSATVDYTAAPLLTASFNADGTASASVGMTATVSALGWCIASPSMAGALSAPPYALGIMEASIEPPIALEASAWSAQMLDQELVETGMTVRQTLRLLAASMGGKVSGAGTGTITFRNAVADDADRIIATVDGSGNRTAVTADL